MIIRIIVYVVLCSVLFGAGLGLAVVLIPEEAPQAELDATVPVELADLVPADPRAELPQDVGIEPTQLPVPVRGAPLSAEELFRFGAMYRQQQEALAKREQEIEQRQARLKLIENDLAGSRKEIDGLQAMVQESVQRADQLLKDLEQQRQQFEQQKKDAESTMESLRSVDDEANAEEATNIRKISSWFQNMPPEKAAEYLRELSNDGNTTSAVKLLENIEERNAAKILAAMEDPALVVELTEAYRNSKRQATRTARRYQRN